MTLARIPLFERFERHYIPEPMSGCWLWTGCAHRLGYGAISETIAVMKIKRHLAHRVAYMKYRGPIPAGMTLDHKCRVRMCVNPWHLEVVTNKENILRGECFSAKYARRTACKHGHAFTSENVAHRVFRGIPQGRTCLTCARIRARKRWAFIKDAVNAARRKHPR